MIRKVWVTLTDAEGVLLDRFEVIDITLQTEPKGYDGEIVGSAFGNSEVIDRIRREIKVEAQRQ